MLPIILRKPLPTNFFMALIESFNQSRTVKTITAEIITTKMEKRIYTLIPDQVAKHVTSEWISPLAVRTGRTAPRSPTNKRTGNPTSVPQSTTVVPFFVIDVTKSRDKFVRAKFFIQVARPFFLLQVLTPTCCTKFIDTFVGRRTTGLRCYSRRTTDSTMAWTTTSTASRINHQCTMPVLLKASWNRQNASKHKCWRSI